MRFKSRSLVLLICLAGFCFHCWAVRPNDVKYINYGVYEDTVRIRLMERCKTVPFTNVKTLREQAQTLTEFSRAQFTPEKISKKNISVPELVKLRRKGVLVICMYSPPTNPLRNGTVLVGATAIVLSKDGVCASNYHVFQSFLDKNADVSRHDSLMFAVSEDGEVYSIDKVLASNKNADAAIFRINPRGDQLYPIPMGNDVETGTRVHAITHVGGTHLYYYSQGVVARTVNWDCIPWGNRTDITADYAKGSSGGPIMDDRANLVAMVSTTHSVYFGSDETTYQSPFQMTVKSTIPVSSLRRLCK